MPRYAELIYNGFWFSPERELLQGLIDQSQQWATGAVRLRLYKGNATVVAGKPYSLYRQDYVTFEEDSVYDHRDAEGFIKLNALRLRPRARPPVRGLSAWLSAQARHPPWPKSAPGYVFPD